MTTAAMPSVPDFPPVLIASPNTDLRKWVGSALTAHRWQVEEAVGGAEAIGKLQSTECQFVVLDRHLPDLHSEDVVKLIDREYPGIGVLMLNEKNGERAVYGPNSEAMEMLVSAVDPSESGKGTGPTEAPVRRDEALPGMIGSSPAMSRVYEMVRLVAPRNSTVLLLGESGTGKELVARAIHELSARARGNFVPINCAAIPDTLIEAELFGHSKGAFTGAVQSRAGRIQAAQGGTLFLDEIGDLPLDTQAKLLRFLESGEMQRLGTAEVFKANVRVIAATNVNLEQKVRTGQFRADLYYRLSVFPVLLPSLRERGNDIFELASAFLAEFCTNRSCFSEASLRKLRSHKWPGNVRELRHAIERASILSNGGSCIREEHISISESALASPRSDSELNVAGCQIA
jgi:DNA-binding NtrC family response regulator